MLPAGRTHRFSLTDVLPNCFAALAGERGALGLAPVRHAVVLVADGLGARALDAHRAYARTLAGALTPKSVIGTVFPTTTVAALASLTTGATPGQHGMVGYTARDPERDRVVALLNGWETDGLDPATWQRHPTLFETSGIRSVVLASPRYRDSGFTRAVLRGAEFQGGVRFADRVDQTLRLLREDEPVLVYLYAPELDMAGHHAGLASETWTRALEELDAELRRLVAALGPRDGLLVTADHGMVDIAREAHVIPAPDLLAGVRHVAGEPRCLQLTLEPGVEADAVAERWRSAEGTRAWVATRAEAIEAGWFGEVDPAVAPRIGDVLIAARKAVAYYVDPEDRARGMVGQHGSLTPDEREIPLLRYGAWA